MGRGTSKRKLSRKRNPQRQLRDRLRTSLARSPLHNVHIVVQPTGVEKMSDVLEEFVEPYFDSSCTIEEYRSLLQVAMAAWNAAIAPEPKRTAMIDDIVARLQEFSDELPTDDLKHILRQMIARKEACFGKNRRTIIDFELRDMGDHWYLNVASLLG
ncbi:MAG: hypothetical protein FJ276_09650 [Planctomycetes bacterium]|nr:hypothetical protein [Planctomycetota bacterium]